MPEGMRAATATVKQDAQGTPQAARAKQVALLTQIEARLRWLSSWTIHNANNLREKRDGLKVGGHQASCASMATLMTALYFNTLRPQDRVAVKPHAGPVFHAIQYLFGNQALEKLQNFRGFGGAQSYPSRTKDTADVDFSTGSVGLGVAITAFASIVQDYVRAKGHGSGPEGRMVALVGGSGGGKSTTADLIPRFYDVKEGGIFIDGRDIRDYTLESLRQQMGIVTQESILFNDTIFNNIAFGKPDATEADVMRAAQIANAHEFIMQTENGYQTNIGDRGVRLSGGQKQRISIARAVFKNPPILILDEATSALDTESERLVQDALGKLMKGRTTLVIAHRLSTIREADEIIVIQEGRIVERGHHKGLLELEKGVYRNLTMMQQLA